MQQAKLPNMALAEAGTLSMCLLSIEHGMDCTVRTRRSHHGLLLLLLSRAARSQLVLSDQAGRHWAAVAGAG